MSAISSAATPATLLCVATAITFCAWLAPRGNGQPSPDRLPSAAPLLRPGAEFGAELTSAPLNVGPTMDVAVAGDFVFAIGAGELRVLALGDRPTLVHTVAGLGNTRQIAVSRGYAFITAREDGLFIVDVREPARAKVASHYDTVELATGIAVSGDVAAVANRFAGVELIDVSNPENPRYLSTVRVGEAQSVVFNGTWLYVGTWSEKAVAVVDVRDPRHPRVAGAVPLDGYGDGVDVAGNLLAAATGHHARAKLSPRAGDSAWGHGHGVEFFELSNPASPRRISGLKFPPFYRLRLDTWGVELAGGHAYVNDAYNGFFLVDVRNPEAPRPVGHRQLPVPPDGSDPSPAAGLAVAGERVFVAGAFDDLHIVHAGVGADRPLREAAELRVPPDSAAAAGPLPTFRVQGAIRAALPWRDDLVLVAAGSAGLQVVRVTPQGFAPVAAYPTHGFARDVAATGDRVFVAESLGGLSIWEAQSDGLLQRRGSYQVPGRSIHQVLLADEGRMAFLAVGANTLQVVRLHAGGAELVLAETPASGLFYREPFSPPAADGRRILVQWHTTGLREYVAEEGTVQFTGYRFPHAMDTECGAVPWGEGWVATSRRGLFFLAPGEQRSPSQIGLLRPGGRALPGKPTVAGTTLLVADPFLGHVSAIDLSRPEQPRLLDALETPGHPGRVRLYRGKVLVPAGREGLILWDWLKTSPGPAG